MGGGTLWYEICRYLETEPKGKLAKTLGKLLSRGEKRAIINRVAVLALLRNGKSYSQIGEIIWVSPVTISTIKKNLWDESWHYKSRRSVVRKKSVRNRESKIGIKNSDWGKLFSDVNLWELIKNPPRPASMGIKKHQYK